MNKRLSIFIISKMQKKVLSIFIAGVMFSFSCLGLLQLNGAVSNSISFVKAAIPYPGKTVFLVDRIIKFNPFDNKCIPEKTAQNNQKDNKHFGFLLYFLTTLVAYNEKYILIILVMLAAVSIKCVYSLRINFAEIYSPPDIKYIQLWRLKFITPIQKCIQYLASKYDINPIVYNGTGMSLRINPHFIA